MGYDVSYKGIIDRDKFTKIEDIVDDVTKYAKKRNLETKLSFDQEAPGIYLFFDKNSEPIDFTFEKTKSNLLIVYGSTDIDTNNLEKVRKKLVKILNELSKKYFNGKLDISASE